MAREWQEMRDAKKRENKHDLLPYSLFLLPSSFISSRLIMSSSLSSSSTSTTTSATQRNKHRVLLFGSRGMTSRDRHLVSDLRQLLVHHKKESKFDGKVRSSTTLL